MGNKGLTNSLASSKSRAKAQFPPNISTHSFDPTIRDYFNFSIGDIWINRGTISVPLQRVWILVNQAQHVATWVLIINGGGGPIVGLQPDVGAVVNPLLGIIEIHNTDGNIVTSNGNPPANRLNVNLATNINISGTLTANNIISNTTINTLNGDVAVANQNNNASGPNINLVKTHGAGGNIQAGDEVGKINFIGFEGSVPPLPVAASIKVDVPLGSTIAVNRVAGRMIFATHPDSVAANPTNRLVINPDGTIQGSKADVGSALVNSLSSLGNIASGGDDGAGLAGYTALTNASVIAAVGVNTLVGVAGGAVNQGYLKLYLGATVIYIPYFTNP